MSDFLAIAADVENEYWTDEHFLRDLPEKWFLSFGMWIGGRPVSYAILSRKAKNQIHLHHFMVAAVHRNDGLGTRMLSEMEDRAGTAGASRVTLKIDVRNPAAKRFYVRAGYRVQNQDGEYLVFEKPL